ncbi:MAG: hypothetical protein WC734_03085 [Patescibacteria group bacterium]|jgi:hypothetical protein
MRYVGILVMVVMMFVGAGQVLAETVTTGVQGHLVASMVKPTPVGNATICLQKLQTPRTGGDQTFVHMGLRRVAKLGQTEFAYEPVLGWVGGWYPGSDGYTAGSKFTMKHGAFSVNLGFEWFTKVRDRELHTRFHSHNAGYTTHGWTVGGVYQNVDLVHKVAPFVAYKWSPHVVMEGRWYQSLNDDPKFRARVNNGRLVLKIS